ncbi:MAG: FAD-binding protein [bacterium]|nr:FAD-binding protein [bacterium]
MTEAGRDTTDLVVVGGSVGGMVAAILAADRGCRVVLVERQKELGGGGGAGESLAAPGSRFQAAAGIDDGPSCLVSDLESVSAHHADTSLAAALAGEAAPLLAWLADRCGLAVTLAPGTPPGHTAPRLHALGAQGGADLVAALVRVVTRHHRLRVRLGAEVLDLERGDDGSVRGVVLKPERRGAPALHGRVLLACGGFAADDAAIAAHCPAVAALPYLGPDGARGDGLRLARAAGAATRGLDACEIAPFLSLPGRLTVPPALAACGAILVDQSGRRFVAETAEPLALAQRIHALPGHVAYLVFDDRVAAAVSASDPFFEHVVMPRTARRGGSVGDLAKQFELDATHLALTLENYDANVELGGDPFGRERTDALEPPLHAIRVTPGRRRTLGGVVVDGRGRALREDGTAVPGLWAVGGVTAALAEEPALPGLEALQALALGRLAALDVVAAADAE